LKTELTIYFRCFIIVLLFIAKILPTLYIMLDSMYMTMSISTGLYPNLDLQNTNKLHYITCYSCLHSFIINILGELYIHCKTFGIQRI